MSSTSSRRTSKYGCLRPSGVFIPLVFYLFKKLTRTLAVDQNVTIIPRLQMIGYILEMVVQWANS
jgi:hypothetical protein